MASGNEWTIRIGRKSTWETRNDKLGYMDFDPVFTSDDSHDM